MCDGHGDSTAKGDVLLVDRRLPAHGHFRERHRYRTSAMWATPSAISDCRSVRTSLFPHASWTGRCFGPNVRLFVAVRTFLAHAWGQTSGLHRKAKLGRSFRAAFPPVLTPPCQASRTLPCATGARPFDAECGKTTTDRHGQESTTPSTRTLQGRQCEGPSDQLHGGVVLGPQVVDVLLATLRLQRLEHFGHLPDDALLHLVWE